jgi:hypothetical protein
VLLGLIIFKMRILGLFLVFKNLFKNCFRSPTAPLKKALNLDSPLIPQPLFSRRRRGEILDFLFPSPAGEGLGVRA